MFFMKKNKPSLSSLFLRALIFAYIFLSSTQLFAHNVEMSSSEINVSEQEIAITAQFPLHDIVEHFHLDKNKNGVLDEDEFQKSLVKLNVKLSHYYKLYDENYKLLRLQPWMFSLSSPQAGNEQLIAKTTSKLPKTGNKITVGFSSAFFFTMGKEHKHLLSISDGEKSSKATLAIGSLSKTFSFTRPSFFSSLKHTFLHLIEGIFD